MRLGMGMSLGDLLRAGGSSLSVGLTHYWAMDEASGTRSDSVGTAHLTDNNTVGSAAGINNTAASFITANSERLSIAADIFSGLTVGTVSVWFNTTDYSTLRALFAAGNGMWMYHNTNGTVTTFVQGTNSSQSSAISGVLAAGSWHNIIATVDTDLKLRAYYDGGEAVTGVALTAAWPKPSTLFTLGTGPALNNYHTGGIDEVAVWSRVLTPDEITTLYNAGAGVFYPTFKSTANLTNGLTHYWTLNEVSGNRADSIGGVTLIDTNTVTSAAGKNGNAASFLTANTEYLDVASLEIPVDFSMSFWFKTTYGATPGYFANRGGLVAPCLGIMLNYPSAGKVGFFTSAGATPIISTVGSSYADGNWHHVVVSHASDGTDTLTLDGSATVTGAGGSPAATGAFRVGYRTDGVVASITTDMDELAMWNRVLTAQERATLYNLGAGKFYPTF